MTEKQFLVKFKKFVDDNYGTNKTAAKAWKCSPVLVGLVIKGERAPTDNMMIDMGLRRIVNKDVKYESVV